MRYRFVKQVFILGVKGQLFLNLYPLIKAGKKVFDAAFIGLLRDEKHGDLYATVILKELSIELFCTDGYLFYVQIRFLFESIVLF